MPEGSVPQTIGRARTGRLALAFQEPLTAVLKVQSVENADYRAGIVKALDKAIESAQAAGYEGEDVKLAEFAVIAFLDEAVLNSRNSRLANWISLQSERLATTDAGKIFFQHLERIRARGNSPDVADLLEVYDLCLLLGFRGELRVIGDAGLPALISMITKKILHIRKDLAPRKEMWSLPDDAPKSDRRDLVVRWLGWAAIAGFVIAIALWTSYKFSLGARIEELRAATVQSSL